MIKKISLLVLATFIFSFVACKKDTEPKQTPTVSVESLPDSEATNSIKSEDDLKTVVKTVFQDAGLNAIGASLIPEEDDSDDMLSMRAAAPTTLEDVMSDINSLVQEYTTEFQNFLAIQEIEKEIKIDEKIGEYSQIQIIDGLELKNTSLSVNLSAKNKIVATPLPTMQITGNGKAAMKFGLVLETDKALSYLECEDIPTNVKGLSANFITDASLEQIKISSLLTQEGFSEDVDIEGLLNTNFAGSVGCSISGDIGGKLILKTNCSVSVDADKVKELSNKLQNKNEESEIDLEYIDSEFSLSFIAYDDEGTETYKQQFTTLEEFEAFMNSIFGPTEE